MSRRIALCMAALCLLLLFAGLQMLAADDTAGQSEETGGISFAGNFTRASLRQGSEEIALSGGAWVRTGNIYIEADAIDIFGQNSRYIACSGNVRLEESAEELELVSNVLNYDRETESLVINGWAELYDRKNEIVARGAYLKNDREAEIILIQINVSILRADEGEQYMYCKADSALFRTAEETLELTGSAEVYYEGSKYEAARIHVDLATNEITMEGGVSGNINESQ